MKKVISLLLVIALTAAVAISGTVAYLTDRENETNVFTMGNVEIELTGNFQQGAELMPGKKIPMMPVIKNTGDNEAWVLLTFAIPAALDEWAPATEVGSNENVIHWNPLGATVPGYVTQERVDKAIADKYLPAGTTAADILADNTTWDVFNKYITVDGVDGNCYREKIDGMDYNVYVLPYQKALQPGETTLTGLYQVMLDERVDVTPEGDMFFVKGGTVKDLKWNVNADKQGLPVVYVNAYGIQKDNFADVEAAVNAYISQWGKLQITADEVKIVEADGQKVEVSGTDADNILADLTSGTDLVVDKNIDIIAFDTNDVDAQGATVTLKGQGPEAYGYLAFLPEASEDVTVENLNVTGSGFVELGHYGMAGGNYTANNLKIENLAATLANGNKGFLLGCAFMGNGDTVLNNCEITGTTAQDGVIPVDLACGQAWTGYTDDDDNKVSTTVNGGKFGTVYCWEHGIATFDGAQIDTLYAAPIKGTVTIKAGTQVDTIKVDYGTSDPNTTKARLSKLVIEDGAIVGTIEFRGNTYTVAQWNAFVAAFNP